MTIAERLARLDWAGIERELGLRGYAETAPVLTREECDGLVALYAEEGRFRSRVEMARHRFGVGDYKYFGAPLPELVAQLRQEAYPPLAAIANRWAGALGTGEHYPSSLAAFLERCSEAGQNRPTPLLLHYEAGGYNCLHQDIYGAVAFPLQLVAFLSRPGVDYTGGEFVLLEQRPRAQSAAEVVSPPQGALVVFTTRTRPAPGSRGYYRVSVRHGVSRIRWGTRYTLGVIFHDSR